MRTTLLMREAVQRLRASGVPFPEADAELLLAQALGRPGQRLADRPRRPGAAEAAAFRRLVERRAGREPLAYILGETRFRGLTLAVDRRAFVPRTGTELVVERSLALLSGFAEPRVLDVGTGSGAIALAIAHEHPTARVTGVERSPAALALARENAAQAGLAERVELLEGDLLTGVQGPFDLVVSNPPYLPPTGLHRLEPEARLYEPRLALVGDGLSSIIAAEAYDALAWGGSLVLECADGQAEGLAGELRRLGYEGVLASFDRDGRDRAVEGTRPEGRALAA